jgi:hypothetical protein
MSQPWPPGNEPGNPGARDMGTVKPGGAECAREWPAGPPGLGYYAPPPPADDGPGAVMSGRAAAREG